MGNSLGGGKKRVKIMKINGETIKLKAPVQAGSVTKDYPGYVLLESEAVKHFGVRAEPLGLYQELKPKRLYFLVELPKFPEDNKSARKVRSGINMSAKDRLESLMLARRSVSDLSFMQQNRGIMEKSNATSGIEPVRLKMKLPKSEVEKLMNESKSQAEAAERIMQLCLSSSDHNSSKMGNEPGSEMARRQVRWKQDDYGRASEGHKAREKRVGFLPVKGGEIEVAADSAMK